MKQQGHFLLLNRSEFWSWLAAQKITRVIERLQVHHTAAPNYSTRRIAGGIAQQDHFAALEGMRDYHIKTNGWIATGQHLTTFEDGKIAVSLDRPLSTAPAGIAGANTGAICIEHIGNFDKGGDVLTQAQRETIAYMYACLCERFDLTPGPTTLVYHAWYTASGEWIGDYKAGKSSKTCPGTAWWGDGNTRAAAMKGFIPAVAAKLKILKTKEVTDVRVDKAGTVVNGNRLGDESVLIEGRVYVPLAGIGKALGAAVEWNNITKTATLTTKGAK